MHIVPITKKLLFIVPVESIVGYNRIGGWWRTRERETKIICTCNTQWHKIILSSKSKTPTIKVSCVGNPPFNGTGWLPSAQVKAMRWRQPPLARERTGVTSLLAEDLTVKAAEDCDHGCRSLLPVSR